MRKPPRTEKSLPRRRLLLRPGFTILELGIIAAIMIILAGITLPRVGTAIIHTRVNRAAEAVANDLRQAFDLAGRMRAPVRVAYTAGTYTYAISNRATGAVIRSRAIGPTSDYALSSITFSPTQIDIFPGGTSSGTLVVTLSGAGFSRQVTATSAGFVRKSQ